VLKFDVVQCFRIVWNTIGEKLQILDVLRLLYMSMPMQNKIMTISWVRLFASEHGMQSGRRLLLDHLFIHQTVNPCGSLQPFCGLFRNCALFAII